MQQTGKLFIVATPIGNLADITFRAVETLRQADRILCEDTRVTRKLLDHYQIRKPLLSYHQRSKLDKVQQIVGLLSQGETLALVTDAGTPGVSDPGNELIAQLLAHFGQELPIIPIPGAAAFTTLIQAAGLNLSRFVFLGFPPNKKGRETFFRELADMKYPAIYYESPYRLLKNLELLKQLTQGTEIRLIVGRELTKFFEQVRRGSIDDILAYYGVHPDKVKGEFVVIAHKQLT